MINPDDECPFCRRSMNTDKPVRSLEQHRRFWEMVKLAWRHWPETHEYQFASLDHCRKYLTMKAGWYDIALQFPLRDMHKSDAIALARAVIVASGKFSIPRIVGDNIVVYEPKSISFRKMSHHSACEIFDQVSSVIRDEIGVSGDELLIREMEIA